MKHPANYPFVHWKTPQHVVGTMAFSFSKEGFTHLLPLQLLLHSTKKFNFILNFCTQIYAHTFQQIDDVVSFYTTTNSTIYKRMCERDTLSLCELLNYLPLSHQHNQSRCLSLFFTENVKKNITRTAKKEVLLNSKPLKPFSKPQK